MDGFFRFDVNFPPDVVDVSLLGASGVDVKPAVVDVKPAVFDVKPAADVASEINTVSTCLRP